MSELIFAVNWNMLNRQLTAKPGALRALARANKGGNLSVKFDNMASERDQNRGALVAIGKVLSDRYHDATGEGPITVYCDDVGGRNWAQNVKHNFFGAVLTANGRGNFWVPYDDLCAALQVVLDPRKDLKGPVERIQNKARLLAATHFNKRFPVSSGAMESRQNRHYSGPGAGMVISTT